MTHECIKTYSMPLRISAPDNPADEVDRRARAHAKQYCCTYAQAVDAVLYNNPKLKADYAAVTSPDAEKPKAGDELAKLARQRMTMLPGETYRQALHAVMKDNPDLKQRYAKGE